MKVTVVGESGKYLAVHNHLTNKHEIIIKQQLDNYEKSIQSIRQLHDGGR